MMQEGVGCGSPGDTRISGVGDVFVMKMYFTELGEYEMNNHVVEYEPDRRIGWEPEAGARAPQCRLGGFAADPPGAAVVR